MKMAFSSDLLKSWGFFKKKIQFYKENNCPLENTDVFFFILL